MTAKNPESLELLALAKKVFPHAALIPIPESLSTKKTDLLLLEMDGSSRGMGFFLDRDDAQEEICIRVFTPGIIPPSSFSEKEKARIKVVEGVLEPVIHPFRFFQSESGLISVASFLSNGTDLRDFFVSSVSFAESAVKHTRRAFFMALLVPSIPPEGIFESFFPSFSRGLEERYGELQQLLGMDGDVDGSP